MSVRSVKTRWKTAAVLLAALLVLIALPRPAAAAEAGLSIEVSYTPVFGRPTVFTVKASGGSGNYRYRMGMFRLKGEDEEYHVEDPSKAEYQKENTFSVTFCVSGEYRMRFEVLDKDAPAYVPPKEITFRLSDPNYPSCEEKADQVAAECLKTCHTEYTRALWLHDWLLEHCEYDYSYRYCNPEGALARGTGTCEAYHRAYTMLLKRVGIATGRITGNGHVWTAVRMDGNWYQVDVTWDDTSYNAPSYIRHLYFGLNDAVMKLVHSDHTPQKGYESNALANHYLIRSGEIRQWSDPLAAQIQSKLDAGQTSFTLPRISVPNYTATDSYDNVLYNLAAYQLSSRSWSAKGKAWRVTVRYAEKQLTVSAAPAPAATTSKTTASTAPPVTQPGRPTNNTPSPSPGDPEPPVRPPVNPDGSGQTPDVPGSPAGSGPAGGPQPAGTNGEAGSNGAAGTYGPAGSNGRPPAGPGNVQTPGGANGVSGSNAPHPETDPAGTAGSPGGTGWAPDGTAPSPIVPDTSMEAGASAVPSSGAGDSGTSGTIWLCAAAAFLVLASGTAVGIWILKKRPRKP